MEEAEALCDRLAIMDHGRILDMGTVDELVGRRFQDRAVHFGQLDGPRRRGDGCLPGRQPGGPRGRATIVLFTEDVPATIGAVLAAADARGVQPDDLSVRRASLEDVFLDLTGRALRD